MIVEALKVDNGLYIPLTEEPEIRADNKVLIKIEFIDPHIQESEKKHREGYLSQPVQSGEFSDWENEQVWRDR